ncbi:MAG: hypothetical protein KDK25_13425, partial [Leptospiraceae bacterium]|nr:hypothetical protein [Leptospiraceae bacterium]
MDSFFLTYYSVSSLIGLVMGLTMGIYFLSVRNSSSAMKFLAMLLICAGSMNVAYFISSSFIEPLAAYHRWITVPVGLLMSMAPAQLFFHYPNNRWPRAARISLIVQLITVVLPVAVFFIFSVDVPLLYHFDGHYWDLVA